MLKLLDKAIAWLESSRKERSAQVQKQAFATQQKTQQTLNADIEKRKEEIREIRRLQEMTKERDNSF
ncbi:MAG: hypothetical protein HWE20_03845 [Gammaproteobacteria bacterium]|nr:hypothetical protein [Gammaproteobacteria bacterium]